MGHNRKYNLISFLRENEPQAFKDWEDFYYQNTFRDQIDDSEKVDTERINEMGKRLYTKILGVAIHKWAKILKEITENDCIEYVFDTKIKQTSNGYFRTKSVVYDNLEHLFPQLVFEEFYTDLDHAGDIDYIGKILGTNKIIGIQIKPTTSNIAFAGYSISDRMKKNLSYFEKEYAGKAFVIYSEKEKIMNKDVVDEIRKYLES